MWDILGFGVGATEGLGSRVSGLGFRIVGLAA